MALRQLGSTHILVKSERALQRRYPEMRLPDAPPRISWAAVHGKLWGRH